MTIPERELYGKAFLSTLLRTIDKTILIKKNPYHSLLEFCFSITPLPRVLIIKKKYIIKKLLDFETMVAYIKTLVSIYTWYTCFQRKVTANFTFSHLFL